MKIGVVKESYPGERRVALIPQSVKALIKDGFEVLIQADAGKNAHFSDAEYSNAGARVCSNRESVFAESDLLVQVRTIGANTVAGITDLGLFKPGQALIGMADPLVATEVVQQLASRKIQLFALEMIPRTTRAQSMDVLSSMATVAGYKGVLLAAIESPKFFPMFMTAAGTVPAAKVLVLGAGVAGLQAIATARRLGGIVTAYDIRPEVKEQIESVGAKFLELPIDAAAAQGAGGYANVMDDAFYRRQRELLAKATAASDVVITTASVPGKKAPVLITREMLQGMNPGSVVVDLAADRGGNCEATECGKTVVREGVTIVGPDNLPATMPTHASQLFSKNVAAFIQYVFKGGKMISADDEIVRGTLMTRDGQIVHPALNHTPAVAAASS